MVDQHTTVETVKRFVEEIKKQGVRLKLAILFGSYARGDLARMVRHRCGIGGR